MIIDLQSVTRSPRHFNLMFQPDWWRESGRNIQIQGLEGPLTAAVHVSRDDEQFSVSGRLKGTLRLVCDRCLETYTYALTREFRLFLSFSEAEVSDQDETELKMEDLATAFITSSEIDLDDIIREQIYLSVPMKTLCENSCAGLCSRCGTNLNVETCRCSENTGHPAFLKLKDLKIR